jgi:hypothetical protein
LSLCNTICTNVPGPQLPLYLLGHKLQRCYPYVPIGGELGLNIAILSYNGTAYFGFGGDVHAVPDIDVLEDLLRESVHELRAAAAAYQPDERGATREVERPALTSPVKAKSTKARSLTRKPKARVATEPQPPASQRRPVPKMIPVPVTRIAQGAAPALMPVPVAAQASD